MSTIIGTIAALMRMNSSRNGNPRWSVSFVEADSTPHVFPTQPDASCAYGLDNPEFTGVPVEFTIKGRQITHVEPVPVACEWFAGCDKPATSTRAHPAFPKGVPVCAHHLTWEG